jgi:pimeloyl-ACP methyl ester carboxylesterase
VKSAGKDVTVLAHGVQLEGMLQVPTSPRGLVVFAHGSGSSRFSSRNQFVAGVLNEVGIATLLFDLLTADENRIDERTREFRFDIELLARRLAGTLDWIAQQRAIADLPVGLFGASTGAAGALIAAAERPERVAAVVSRGGRPDLAAEHLPRVAAPTLLIVGGDDSAVLQLNREALAALRCEKRLEIVPHATHLFEEPGALEQVAALAAQWFALHLLPAS